MGLMRVVASLLLTGTVAAACGDGDGDDSSEARDEYVDAIAATRQDEQFTSAETECIARVFVDAIGVAQLEAVVTPDEIRDNVDSSPADLGISMNDQQRDVFWNDLNACVDVREIFIEGIAADEELSDEAVECLEGAIDDDVLKPLIVTVLVEGQEALEQDDELVAMVFSLFSECPEAADV